jgi:plasmid stability protein
MATLNIRRLPEDVHARLRVRAAKAGRSMEAEARMILAEAVRKQPPKMVDLEELRAFMLRLYGGELPGVVVDDLNRRAAARGPARAGGVIVLDGSALLAICSSSSAQSSSRESQPSAPMSARGGPRPSGCRA